MILPVSLLDKVTMTATGVAGVTVTVPVDD
jgi:hypothetical protein